MAALRRMAPALRRAGATLRGHHAVVSASPAAWSASGGDGRWSWAGAAIATTAVGLGVAAVSASCDVDTTSAPAPGWKPGLPTYTMDEVSKHSESRDRIWVTYKDGVYDITEFVGAHPGGSEKIMMAAGSQVDPFWALYQQHKTMPVFDILGPLRIGNLDARSALHNQEEAAESDPFVNEPKRHPGLVVTKQKPFNAETPLAIVPDNYITPAALWYCRHHHPVPLIDPKTFRFEIAVDAPDGGKAEDMSLSISLDDLKTGFPKRSVTATMQCGGNRRSELNPVAKTQGLAWGQGAMSTATWAGASVREIFRSIGINSVQQAKDLGIKYVVLRRVGFQRLTAAAPPLAA